MVGLALLVDGAQVLLDILLIGFAINWIISAFTWMIFFIWLKFKGVSMADARGTRILLAQMSVLGVEILPLISWLPAWTAFAVGLLVVEYGQKFLHHET